MTRKHRLFNGLLIILLFLAAGTFCISAQVHAGVVQPSGETYGDDYYNIMDELYETGTVTLKSGATYYLTGMIHPKNGWTINATGATIIVNRDAISNDVTATNYNSLNGFTIRGGTWKSTLSKGVTHSFIKFTHAQNINLYDMTIIAANVEHHTIELTACKNVVISGCTIRELGTPKKTSVEEAIQIDVCTPSTAPYIDNQARFCNGAGCKNITIRNCNVTGPRAVCANFLSPSGSQYKKYKKAANLHDNIIIKNCTLTGTVSEGLALFNTLNAVVSGNKITSKSKRTSQSYSVGCHLAIFYPVTKKAVNSAKITISDNKIYGGRQALNVDGHGSSYGKVTIKKNKLYCKKGPKQALHTSWVKTLKVSGNTTKKW